MVAEAEKKNEINFVNMFRSVGAVQELRDPFSKSGIWVHVRQRRRICSMMIPRRYKFAQYANFYLRDETNEPGRR